MAEPRLGRRVQFDERSRSFGIRELLPPVHKPRSYTWSCPVALSQGNTNSCVGHAIAHDAAARPVSIKNVTHDTAMEVYRRALQLDPWEGEEDEGTSILAGMKAAMEKGWYSQYRWAFSLEDAIDALTYFGPVIFGVPWYESMFEVDSQGIVKPEGRVVGGHAIMGRGANRKKKLVRWRNSWDDGWGIGGDCFISFDDLEKLLHQEGECCIPVKRDFGKKP